MLIIRDFINAMYIYESIFLIVHLYFIFNSLLILRLLMFSLAGNLKKMSPFFSHFGSSFPSYRISSDNPIY